MSCGLMVAKYSSLVSCKPRVRVHFYSTSTFYINEDQVFTNSIGPNISIVFSKNSLCCCSSVKQIKFQLWFHKNSNCLKYMPKHCQSSLLSSTVFSLKLLPPRLSTNPKEQLIHTIWVLFNCYNFLQILSQLLLNDVRTFLLILTLSDLVSLLISMASIMCLYINKMAKAVFMKIKKLQLCYQI